MASPAMADLLRLIDELPAADVRRLVAEAQRRLRVDVAPALRLSVIGERPVTIVSVDGTSQTLAVQDHVDLAPDAVVADRTGEGGHGLSRPQPRSVVGCAVVAIDGGSRVRVDLQGLHAGAARFGTPEVLVFGSTADSATGAWRQVEGTTLTVDVTADRPVFVLVVGRGLRLDPNALFHRGTPRERPREELA